MCWFGYQGPEYNAEDNIASSSLKNKPKEAKSEVKFAQEEIRSLKSQLQKQKRTAEPEVESRYYKPWVK